MSASQPDTPQNETPPSDFSNYKNIFTYDEINKYLSNIPVINGLNKLYEKTSYLDRYGGSVVIAVFTTIGIFMFFTYSYLKNHSDVIKNNWQKNRCNPLYIPFAGIIIDPKNMTKNEYATENFFHCFGILLKDIVEAALAPIQAATILITATASVMMQTMNSLMGAILYLRNAFSSGFGLLGNRSLNALTLITKLSQIVKNSISQGQGVLVIIMYIFFTAYGMLSSFFFVLIIAALAFLAVMLAAMLVAWGLFYGVVGLLYFFPWLFFISVILYNIAIGLTLAYVVILIMVIVVIVFTVTVMKKTSR
jgi:hypothetical protein